MQVYEDKGVILANERKVVLRAVAAIRQYDIPPTVKTISDAAFKNCTQLVEVTVPEGVRAIPFEAFSGCTSLRSVKLPSTLRSIGKRAFAGCDSLEACEIPEKCGVRKEAFPPSCKVLRPPEAVAWRACQLAKACANDGVEIVGMQCAGLRPDAEAKLQVRCGNVSSRCR